MSSRELTPAGVGFGAIVAFPGDALARHARPSLRPIAATRPISLAEP